ncbi:MAG: phenylacetate-CoA ligase [Oleiphilaceae bacterium]|jgi:phenylacetate-CoA ligase
MAGLLSIYHSLPPAFQNVALSSYGLLLRQLRYGRSFRETLARRKDGELDPLMDQSGRLRELIEVALQTEHYGKLLNDQPLSASEIDLSSLTSVFPILEKKAVINGPTAFQCNIFKKSNTTTLHTSGTTGAPLNILATKNSVRQNYAFFNLFLRSIGVEEFNRSATFAGRLIVPERSKVPPFWRKNHAMNTLLCSSYHLSIDTVPLYIKALENWQPIYIDSYPSAIYELASYINSNRLKHNIRLKAVVTSSETLGSHQREAIEKAFQCPVFDQYGCAEMAVMAYQCKDGRYFIPPQYAIAEVLDDNDKPVKPGESGHLVCTGLLNQAMPLIRYRIGDIVKTSKEQLEGYPFIAFLDSIEGRNDDVVIASSGFRVGRLDPVFKGIAGLAETQIVQKSYFSLEVNLVVSNGYTKNTEDQIRDALQDRLGVAMHINFEYLDRIPREKNGKFKAVKSELGRHLL